MRDPTGEGLLNAKQFVLEGGQFQTAMEIF